jgi:hypothetical protein
MKTKEEILKECGFVVTVHEEEIGLVTTAFIEPFMKAMESYASQQIAKYRELVKAYDELTKMAFDKNTPLNVFRQFELQDKVKQLKIELGL